MSGARSIGAQRLVELCVAIETCGASGDPERLAPLIADLNAEIQAVLAYVAQWLQQQRSGLTEPAYV